MKAPVLFLWCLAAAPLLARAGDPVVLVGPEESTKGELDQCAAALTRRFAAAGLKGLKAAAVEKDDKRTVEVTSKDEIPPETRARVETLARHAGQKPVLKFTRELTADEIALGFDVHKVGDPKTTKAPRGTAWADALSTDLKSTRTESGGGQVMLLRDSPYVNWSDVSVTDKGTTEWSFKLSAASTKVVISSAGDGDPRKRMDFVYLRIAFDTFAILYDSKMLLSEGKTVLKEATFKLPAELGENLEAVMRNPMPRALKVPEKK